MAAINHGGTFYRLIKVRSLVTAAKQTSWPCILRASKSCRSHSQLKAFRSAIASLKLKRKATASEQDHSRPSLHAMPPERLAAPPRLLPTTHIRKWYWAGGHSTKGLRAVRGPPNPATDLQSFPWSCSQEQTPVHRNAIWTIAFPVTWRKGDCFKRILCICFKEYGSPKQKVKKLWKTTTSASKTTMIYPWNTSNAGGKGTRRARWYMLESDLKKRKLFWSPATKQAYPYRTLW